MYVVQSRGRGRTGLGEVQGSARSDSGLRAHTSVMDQGSAAGSGLGSKAHGCTALKGAHYKGSALVVAAVGSSSGTGRAGLTRQWDSEQWTSSRQGSHARGSRDWWLGL